MRAHPRAGGENSGTGTVRGFPPGSSPRGRGKPQEGVACALRGGLIPARAGKTQSGSRRRRARAAHPRAGGENGANDFLRTVVQGSSPRGRGKRRKDCLPRPRLRLIPARAGKTCEGAAQVHAHEAHPRAGGENHRRSAPNGVKSGSSPRGRGKLTGPSWAAVTERLIPARAGKTSRRGSPLAAPRAHPRAGGENEDLHLMREGVAGSSPARAGKTRCRSSKPTSATAHPRAGGENTAAAAPMAGPNGSSPRGRGKLNRRVEHVRCHRLIPARAGKT